MNKRISKKIIAVLTALAMLVSGMTLVVPEKAEAASGVKMIAPGVSCIAAPTAGAEGWTGDFVFYGSYKGQPLKWRVLDASGTAGNSSVEGGVLLQVPDVLREDGAEVQKPYAEVGDWLNGDSEGQFLEGFGTEEKSALIASEKKAVAGSPTSLLKSADLTGQRVFLPTPRILRRQPTATDMKMGCRSAGSRRIAFGGFAPDIEQRAGACRAACCRAVWCFIALRTREARSFLR